MLQLESDSACSSLDSDNERFQLFNDYHPDEQSISILLINFYMDDNDMPAALADAGSDFLSLPHFDLCD